MRSRLILSTSSFINVSRSLLFIDILRQSLQNNLIWILIFFHFNSNLWYRSKYIISTDQTNYLIIKLFLLYVQRIFKILFMDSIFYMCEITSKVYSNNIYYYWLLTFWGLCLLISLSFSQGNRSHIRTYSIIMREWNN